MRSSLWLIVLASCSPTRAPAPAPIESTVAADAPGASAELAADWLPACRTRFAAEGQRYAVDAPAQFPPDSGYHRLSWAPVEREEPVEAALVELVPGRSWELHAAVVDREVAPELSDRVPAFEEEGIVLTGAWQDVSETYGGIYRARQVGSVIAVIHVGTERPGHYATLDEHPIAALFVERFETAIDACLRGAR